MNAVYVGLGSNLDNPSKQLNTAIQNLKLLPRSKFVTHSRFYQNPPLDNSSQPHYINAVAKIETLLNPYELLEALLAIEVKQGRVRNGLRWQARTLDLDLLLYNNEILKTETLTLPHPGIKTRSFLLYPLLEIDNDLVLPNGETLTSIIPFVKNNLSEMYF